MKQINLLTKLKQMRFLGTAVPPTGNDADAKIASDPWSCMVQFLH